MTMKAPDDAWVKWRVAARSDAGTLEAMGALVEGDQVGRYRIERELGRGGMGEVYQAFDTLLERSVALKIMSDAEAEGGKPGATTARYAKLLDEARAAAALRHPHVVTIFDVGLIERRPFIAMELLDGKALRAFLGVDGIDLSRKLRWLEQVAAAIAAAHGRRLVHRDIKPDNIMVCDDDVIKVLDFGIARLVLGDSEDASGREPSSQRTSAGWAVGTPRYMAPEQSEGRPVDERADQFAWGLVAYELLTGVHPRELRPGFGSALGWSEPAAPILGSMPELAPAIGSVIDRALERSAERRAATMSDIVATLASHRAGPSVQPPQTADASWARSTPPERGPSLDRDGTTRDAPPTLGRSPGSPGSLRPHRARPDAAFDDDDASDDALELRSPSNAAGRRDGTEAAPPRTRGTWLLSTLGLAAVVGLAFAVGRSGILGKNGAEVSPMKASSMPPAAPTAASSSLAAEGPSTTSASSEGSMPANTAAGSVPAVERTADAVAPSHPAGESTSPTPRPVHVSARLMTSLLPSGYREATLLAALGPGVASTERCLNAKHVPASRATGANLSLAFSPMADPSTRVDARFASATVEECVRSSFGTLPLGPAPSGAVGAFNIALIVTE